MGFERFSDIDGRKTLGNHRKDHRDIRLGHPKGELEARVYDGGYDDGGFDFVDFGFKEGFVHDRA